MSIVAWVFVVAVPVLGWLCAVFPPRPRRDTRRAMSERAVAARLHPTEARGVRRLPGGCAVIFNPLSLLVGLVLEAALAWWRVDTYRRRTRRRVVVVDRRQPMARVTVYSARGRR